MLDERERYLEGTISCLLTYHPPRIATLPPRPRSAEAREELRDRFRNVFAQRSSSVAQLGQTCLLESGLRIRSGAKKIDQSSLSNWPLLFRVRMGNATRALRPRPGGRSQSID